MEGDFFVVGSRRSGRGTGQAIPGGAAHREDGAGDIRGEQVTKRAEVLVNRPEWLQEAPCMLGGAHAPVGVSAGACSPLGD